MTGDITTDTLDFKRLIGDIMKKFVYTTFQVDSLPFEPQGKPRNTRAGSLSLLQWIFLTQELNQGLLHCRWIPYQLRYQESPKVKVAQSCLTLHDLKDHTFHRILQARIQEWVAFPFSRGSSQPKDRPQVSHITGGLFMS